MTVSELRNLIKDLPDDAEIVRPTTELYDSNVWVSHTDTVDIIRVKRIKDNKIVQRACKETAGAKKCLVIY